MLDSNRTVGNGEAGGGGVLLSPLPPILADQSTRLILIPNHRELNCSSSICPISCSTLINFLSFAQLSLITKKNECAHSFTLIFENCVRS